MDPEEQSLPAVPTARKAGKSVFQELIAASIASNSEQLTTQMLRKLQQQKYPASNNIPIHTSPQGGVMIGLDFETYGTRDLRTVGLDNYMADPEFRVLMAGVRFANGTREVYDFMTDGTALDRFMMAIDKQTIAAHNAGFERSVLDHMKLHESPHRIVDSAVTARLLGASSALEHATPQLLAGHRKMKEGKSLIEKFSKPTKEGRCLAQDMADAGTLADDADWQLFAAYCAKDADLGWRIQDAYGHYPPRKELDYELITHEMNQTGWKVDIPAVQEMKRRYEENLEEELARFHLNVNAEGLNLNSSVQLKKWCAERGIRATSFDEQSVADLYVKLGKKLGTVASTDPKRDGYVDVYRMLSTKQILGGSSLKKLKVILDTVSEDGRLRNQYMHAGAGQTYRTSGRGVQMQNLKRLHMPRNMEELYDDTVYWDNDTLAENIRQVFTASTLEGALIVGDFSSVESRGLALLAGEKWKVAAYEQGKDLYKVLASQIYGVPYDDVTKDQRQTGKVGELSCGYGAGPAAVVSFATGMGVDMDEVAATKLVADWRAINPQIVELWAQLDRMLDAVLTSKQAVTHTIMGGWKIRIQQIQTPSSLTAQHPGAQSIEVSIITRNGNEYLTRVFQGCYRRGRQICYYKPSGLASGDSWSSSYKDPKSSGRKYYSIYGGKLTGILTQSLCREIFFESLERFALWAASQGNIQLVGQFHDEIVVDYTPRTDGLYPTMRDTEYELRMAMTRTSVPGFPLDAEIKSAYRYIK